MMTWINDDNSCHNIILASTYYQIKSITIFVSGSTQIKRLKHAYQFLAYVSDGLLTGKLKSPVISNLADVRANCSNRVGNSSKKSFSFRSFSLDGDHFRQIDGTGKSQARGNSTNNGNCIYFEPHSNLQINQYFQIYL